MNPNEKRFEGLAISEFKNKFHALEIEKETVMVHQSFSSAGPHCDILEFTFEMDRPFRFRIDVLLPETLANACVTLNAQVLIGYFSSVFPADCEFPVPSICGSEPDPSHEKFSTLSPGKFQSVNFKWLPTDVLKFYFFYS